MKRQHGVNVLVQTSQESAQMWVLPWPGPRVEVHV